VPNAIAKGHRGPRKNPTVALSLNDKYPHLHLGRGNPGDKKRGGGKNRNFSVRQASRLRLKLLQFGALKSGAKLWGGGGRGGGGGQE